MSRSSFFGLLASLRVRNSSRHVSVQAYQFARKIVLQAHKRRQRACNCKNVFLQGYGKAQKVRMEPDEKCEKRLKMSRF
jgi:hypothetical protein